MHVASRTGLAVSVALGLSCGVVAYTFVYARGASYLTDAPEACVNCHLMREQYEAWSRSSHHSVAVCNDCHTPEALLAKYWTKAQNGFWHSFYFTLGRYPDPVRITPRNRRVTEQACRRCHAPMVQAIDAPAAPARLEPADCLACHRNVGHLH